MATTLYVVSYDQKIKYNLSEKSFGPQKDKEAENN